MEKDWKQVDLSNATIFDLTDDEEMIRLAEDCIEGEPTPERATYNLSYSRTHIVDSMIAFADMTENKPLYHAILAANPDYEEFESCIVFAKTGLAASFFPIFPSLFSTKAFTSPSFCFV